MAHICWLQQPIGSGCLAPEGELIQKWPLVVGENEVSKALDVEVQYFWRTPKRISRKKKH